MGLTKSKVKRYLYQILLIKIISYLKKHNNELTTFQDQENQRYIKSKLRAAHITLSKIQVDNELGVGDIVGFESSVNHWLDVNKESFTDYSFIKFKQENWAIGKI